MPQKLPEGALLFSAKLRKAFDEVIAAPDLNPRTKPFVESMKQFGETHGFVTAKQASKLGTYHTAVVTKGYSENSWWK